MFFSKPLLYLLLLCSCFVTLGLQATPPANDVTPKSVTFVLKRATGEPLQNVSVVVAVLDRRWLGGGVTDEQGRTVVADIPCPSGQDFVFQARIAMSRQGWNQLTEASQLLYHRTAIRSPQSCTIAAADTEATIHLTFDAARIIRGSVDFPADAERIENLTALAADFPDQRMPAEPGFSISHVRQTATTLFYGGSKYVGIPIPAGIDDVDVGTFTYVPEESKARVVGEIDVDPSLLDHYAHGLENGLTFIRLADRAVFVRSNTTGSAGTGPDRRRTWPLGDSKSESPSLALPIGEYLVVPGRFFARDYQMRAYEKVIAGEPLPPPCKVFTAVAGQRTDIGRIDYKAMIDYFLTPPQPPPAP
ncbi:MAG TPA: hypothetical protein VK157_09500 [Phycisphaerales bacterium]|nr:hypothetical protein [Phycisphaerales bacterium]